MLYYLVSLYVSFKYGYLLSLSESRGYIECYIIKYSYITILDQQLAPYVKLLKLNYVVGRYLKALAL